MSDLTVLDLLERSVLKSPDAPVVVAPESTLIYSDLQASAKRVAAGILKQTSKPVVALFFPMSPEFVVAYFGALYAAREALPLNLLLPPEELKYILNDSGA